MQVGESNMKINIVVGSTRQARGSDKVAKWVATTAKNMGIEADFTVVDLMDYKLEMFDGPMPPQGMKDRQEEGDLKQWLNVMGDADGYVFVTPEYNHSIPAVLKNAIDYLDFQLMKKPSAIVSHGAIGGARANEHLRLILNSNLGSVIIPESVTLKAPVAFAEVILDDGTLHGDYNKEQSPLEALLGSIVWYTAALHAARNS